MMAHPCPLKSATIVFARVPGYGRFKTRLAASEGGAFALTVYRELLGLTAQALFPLHHQVAFTGADDPGELTSLFPAAARFFPQRGGTLGSRLRSAFLDLAGSGYGNLCAIGCDCPTLSARDIADAFRWLDKGYHAAIGPAQDGGYYLIASSAACVGLFEVDGWSTPLLLRETLACARRLGFRCRLLEAKSDIDSIADYRRWKESDR